MSIFAKENTQGSSNLAPRLNAGERVKVILKRAGYHLDKNNEETDDISFTFKGTEEGNTGEFTEVIWANNFDEDNERYDAKWAGWHWNRIVHVITAVVPEDDFFDLYDGEKDKFDTIMRKVFKHLKTLMNKEGAIEEPLVLKAVLDKKYFVSLPLFPDFISSRLTPTRDWTTDPQYDIYVAPQAPTEAPGEILEIDPTADVPGDMSDDTPF